MAPTSTQTPLELFGTEGAAQRRGPRDPRHGARVRHRPGPAPPRGVVRVRHAAGPRAGPRARQAGHPRHAPRGLRLRRHQLHGVRPGLPGARGRRLRGPVAGERAGLAGDVRHLAVRLGGAEAGVAAADGRRRGDRLLRPHRARLRLQPGRHAHPRPPRRRRLGPRRHQDLDHQRLDLRRRRGLGPHRRRDNRIAGFVVPTDTPGSPRPRSSGRCRCAPRSPPSSCSTASGCPRTRCCRRRAACPGRCPA